jgi:hypothetical protein
MVLAALCLFAGGVERRVKLGQDELVYLCSEALPGQQNAPVLVFLHGNEQASPEMLHGYFNQWEQAAREKGWHLILPWTAGRYRFASDEGVRAVREILRDFSSMHRVDPRRVFLAGHGDGAPAVFYALSRVPDQWAAGLAIGGDVARAVETNRLFAGNAATIPILWVYEANRLPVLQGTINRLRSAGLNLSLQAADEFTVSEAISWLQPHQAEVLPARVDYETGSPEFAGTFWVKIRHFDFELRNDALDSTRVDPGTGAFLRLGGFGYDPAGAGPGIVVKWLPEKYKGPLEREDVIVSIAGTMIEDAAHYGDFMESQRESRDVGIILLRKGKSQRIETRIVIPHRDEAETARVHAEYLAEAREIMLVSRGAQALELNVPKAWAPVKISWNGLELAAAAGAGCWTLTEGKEEAAEGCSNVPPAPPIPSSQSGVRGSGMPGARER